MNFVLIFTQKNFGRDRKKTAKGDHRSAHRKVGIMMRSCITDIGANNANED